MAPRRKFDFKFKEKVLEYAENHSGEQAARHFNIDSKRIRYWRKQKAELLSAEKERARLPGGGRKKFSLELEKRLSEWIYSVWDKHGPLTRNMITNKALEIYPSVSDGGQSFVASRGWLQRFLQRNNLSLRRCTVAGQEDPNQLTEKLVAFVDFVGKTVKSKRISERDIIAMNETVVWFDVVSPANADARGVKSLVLKSTGHEKNHLTVVLAAKADGTKLKPYIVFRGSVDEVKAAQQQISTAVISTSVNGWMNDALTIDWLKSVVGQSTSTPRLLVWDSYRCHISATTRAELKCGYDLTTAAIPRGCAKYIQAADVMWNQPFKQILHETFNQWTARASVSVLVDWVVAAWDKLDKDMIRKSFKVCGLSANSDGSEDNLILCFRDRQLSAAGREALSQVRQQSQINRCEAAQTEEDEEELLNNELVVLDDEDNSEDEDFEAEDSDHMSSHCFVHQALPSNNRKPVTVKEEQQDWSSSLDQEDPEPPHIKEEQPEVWTSPADAAKLLVTLVKREEDDEEEKPQSSQFHHRLTEQMETEQDCGGPEPDRNSDPDPGLQAETDEQTEDSSEAETDDSDDWTETREPLRTITLSQHMRV